MLIRDNQRISSMKLARRKFFSVAVGAASMPAFSLSGFARGSQLLAEQLELCGNLGDDV
jgi:hypothetical protein